MVISPSAKTKFLSPHSHHQQILHPLTNTYPATTAPLPQQSHPPQHTTGPGRRTEQVRQAQRVSHSTYKILTKGSWTRSESKLALLARVYRSSQPHCMHTPHRRHSLLPRPVLYAHTHSENHSIPLHHPLTFHPQASTPEWLGT